MRPRNASPILNRKTKPSTAAAMANPLRRKKLVNGLATVPANHATTRPNPLGSARPEAIRASSSACAAMRSAAEDSRTKARPTLQRMTTAPRQRKVCCQ